MSAALATTIATDAVEVLPAVPDLVADAEGLAGQHGTSLTARLAALESAIGHISSLLGTLFPKENNIQNVLQAASVVAQAGSVVATQVK